MNGYLLDTTYIMPFFGIDVTIPNLKVELARILQAPRTDIHVTSCSLIEAKWKAIRNFSKTGNKEYLARASKALESMGANRYIDVIDSWFVRDASMHADALLVSGHQDYMDCWIAGTARAMGLVLVTEDGTLLSHVQQHLPWDGFTGLNWHEFLESLGPV